MKKYSHLVGFAALVLALLGLTAWQKEASDWSYVSYHDVRIKMPFKKEGLSVRQAAAHLLNRFTFGAKPNQVDEVVQQGLENWLTQQLDATLPEDSLNQKLEAYPAVTMSVSEIAVKYPVDGQVIRMIKKEGFYPDDSVAKLAPKDYQNVIDSFMRLKVLHHQSELVKQIISQKVIRSAFSNNQLQEVLTSFWFNHFNITLNKNECVNHAIPYERDVLRKHAMGKFEDLLLSTAKSPAMLAYLDNYRSVANEYNSTEDGMNKLRDMYTQVEQLKLKGDTGKTYKALTGKIKNAQNVQGLNENYAREIMELHTLGVDGGYTQTDVTNAAKVFTGWTIFPLNDYIGSQYIKKLYEKSKEEKLLTEGYVRDSCFFFAQNRHDKTEKVVLGTVFPANGGFNEGLQLIHLLAHHPSTAKFIARKLAVRFVSDNPPASLIDKMAATFTKSDGDIRQVLITMVNAKEFWNSNALREKTKSPFELVISTVRSLDAKVELPFQLFIWSQKMGEKIYHYLAPTGFPDKGLYWINTGSLLSRMNFGIAVANQQIAGLKYSLVLLNHNHEPESPLAALETYSKLLLPERDVTATIQRLSPLISDPEIGKKIATIAAKSTNNALPPEPPTTMGSSNDMMMMGEMSPSEKPKEKKNTVSPSMNTPSLAVGGKPNNKMLSQIVGIIIGSPEFQRR